VFRVNANDNIEFSYAGKSASERSTRPFLSIKLQNLALYILATIYRDSDAATSVGLKQHVLNMNNISTLNIILAFFYEKKLRYEAVKMKHKSVIKDP
jgi:hypothetical protein